MMTDEEFGRAVQEAYEREIASGKSKTKAQHTAERFRSALIISLARAAQERREKEGK